MDILDFYRSHFDSTTSTSDYKIAEFATDFYIRIDKDKNLVVVMKPKSQCRRTYNINTKTLSLECNAKVSFSTGNHENVHILKCLLHNKKEKEIFLEVAKLFISDDYSDKYVIDTFNTLQSFFSDKKELTDNELTGFYAELYTILKFHDYLNIEKYWQSRDRLKFDFSFSEKLKLEVKSTTKENRTHHFLHEQLNSKYYDIYVLSYMFRYDDKGLSLYDLIVQVRPILQNYKDLSLRLKYIEKNTSIDRLKDLRFNQIYTDEKMHFYSAQSIPKFKEDTPIGVSEAEYDCSLENIKSMKEKDFIDFLKSQYQI